MMYDIIISAVISFLVSIVAGILLIPALKRLKFGQSIREEGPKWHMHKSGTPTMGGFIFIAGIIAATFIAGFNLIRNGEYSHVFILGFSLIFSVIGFIDDWFKVKKKQNLGLSSIQKLMLQLAVAAAFIALLRYFHYLETDVYIPFFDVTFHMELLPYAIISLLVIGGMVNAVNLTDGVDGLCTSVTIPIACLFTLLGYFWAKGGLSVFGAALIGGLCAFLIFNRKPAKVFMGDTGSLFLGGAVCGLSFVSGVPLLIIVVGLVYIFEMFSVMLQVTYFKFTHGKRIFKMSPFHHHLEMSGWGEKKIVLVFSVITIVLCVLGYIGVSNIPRV